MTDLYPPWLRRALLDAAVGVAGPVQVMVHLPDRPKGRSIAVGARKSSTAC